MKTKRLRKSVVYYRYLPSEDLYMLSSTVQYMIETQRRRRTSCAGSRAQGETRWGWLADRWEMSASEKRHTKGGGEGIRLSVVGTKEIIAPSGNMCKGKHSPCPGVLHFFTSCRCFRAPVWFGSATNWDDKGLQWTVWTAGNSHCCLLNKP